MKSFSILSSVAILLGAGCLFCIFKEYHLIAASAGLAAYWFAYTGLKNETNRWQIITFIIISGIFGYSLSPLDGLHLLSFSMLCLGLMSSLGLLLFHKRGYASSHVLEFSLFGAAVVLYVTGGIYDGLGWITWAFPLPSILWAGFYGFGLAVGIKELKIVLKDRYGVQPGNAAPVFTLADQHGNQVCLADYKDKRHVLIVFIRGDWCPTCHIMLRSYEKDKAKFAEKNIVVLAIGPDPVGVNKDMMDRLGLDYKILSDDKNEAAKAYGMMFMSNNPFTNYQDGVPLPASFLVDINGKIAYTSNPRTPGEILRPETIFPIVEKLQVA